MTGTSESFSGGCWFITSTPGAACLLTPIPFRRPAASHPGVQTAPPWLLQGRCEAGSRSAAPLDNRRPGGQEGGSPLGGPGCALLGPPAARLTGCRPLGLALLPGGPAGLVISDGVLTLRHDP